MRNYATNLYPLWFLTLIITCWNAMATTTGQSGGIIRGSVIPCNNEGMEEFIHGISEDPCITCTCQSREVVCKRESCPHAPSCYLLLLGKRRSCCESCKGCEYRGTFHPNGDIWSDPVDPCAVNTCQSGVITSTRIQCHVPCRHSLPPATDQCCPQCPTPSCSETKNISKIIDSESIDQCVQCKCQLNGHSICWKQSCPVLPCPPSRYVQKKNECCPHCRGSKRGFDTPSKCDLGSQTISSGQSLNYDFCTQCSCNGSTAICQRTSCPALDCPADLQIRQQDVCCPRCKGQQELQHICSFRGKVYQDGDTWKLDKCSRCECIGTKVNCEYQDCSKLPPCPPRFQLKTLPGECCPTCVEEDAVCSAFGERHFKSFDGHMYHFQGGSCRYLLAKDCSSGSSFAINIVNDAKSKTTTSGVRSVILKVDNVKVQLGQNLRVKFGRKRIRLPFIHLGVLSITLENKTVVLRTNIGVKILWDAENYLEVSVPTQFKQKICGLCGNYNGDPNDDFKTKKGHVVIDPLEFGQSWQSGKKSECRQKGSTLTSVRSTPIDCSMSWESRNRARRECSIFKQSLLSTCQSTVNPSPYFHSCMMDVCECRQSKKCHCQTIKAYARECERSGLILPSWKNATNCEGSQCPAGASYTACGSSCRKTCKNHHLNRSLTCKKKCQSGCECATGKVWHRHRCIATQNCPQT